MFLEVGANNVFSWEDLKYTFTKGISQITGINLDDNTPEGSGKSSIANILCWTLYGEVPKAINTDDVIREGVKGCKAYVLLEDGHTIHRSRKPNNLYIETPDKKKVMGKDAKETQRLINELIGLSFHSFCQTVYFAQGYEKRFISASETEKSKILSEILDLEVFDKAREKARTRVKEIEADYNNTVHSIKIIESKLQGFKDKAEIIKKVMRDFDREQNSRMQALAEQIVDLESRKTSALTEIEGYNEKEAVELVNQCSEMLDNLLEKQAEIKQQLKNSEATLREYNSRSSFISRLKEDVKSYAKQVVETERESASLKKELKKVQKGNKDCPTCGEKLSPEKYQEHIEPLLKDLQVKFEKNEVKMSKILEKWEKGEKELEHAEREFSKTEHPKKATDLEEFLEEILKEQKIIKARRNKAQEDWESYNEKRKQIEKLDTKIENLHSQLAQEAERECSYSQEDLETIKDIILETDNEKQVLETYIAKLKSLISKYNVLRDGFKEIKQYVFQRLLQELSRKATDFAQKLFEQPVSIEFSNETEEGVSKIKALVNLDGNERVLGLFSGGQLKRLQLSVDLALSNIVAQRASKPINIRIFDEPFQHLSETSMAKVVELLKTLPGKTVIIEHNSVIQSIVESTFEVILKDGISRRAS